MKNRIKQLRKELHLTQQEFSNRIGISRGNIAAYEVGKNAPSDSVISLICREFNVNENWLRTGNGDTFLPTDRNSDISKLTKQLLSEESDSFKNRFISVLANLSVDEWKFLENKAKELYEQDFGAIKKTQQSTQSEKTVAELEEEYKKTVLHSAPKTESIVSNITTDTGRKNKAVGEE